MNDDTPVAKKLDRCASAITPPAANRGLPAGAAGPGRYSRAMRRVVVVWSLIVAVAGCGGGDDDEVNGPGRYDSPLDFDRSGCTARSLAGLDPQAIYHVQIDYGGGFGGVIAARIDALGGGAYGGAVSGADATRVTVSDDDLFWYREVEAGSSRTLDLCDQRGNLLVGRYAYCNPTDCYLATARARPVRRLTEADASGLALLGEYAPAGIAEGFDGIGVNVRVAGDQAFLANYWDGLRIVDISDPTRPTELGHGPPEYPAAHELYNDVKLVDAGGRRYALMASNKAGVVVWDVTTPGAPVIAAHFGLAPVGEPSNVHTIFVDGQRAYLANIDLGLEIWDIADPAAPVALGRFAPAAAPAGAFLHDLYVAGDRAYLDYWSAGMVVVDVAAPAQVRELGRFADYGEQSSHSSWVTQVGNQRIAAHGDEQWGSHLRLVDVTEGTAGFVTQVGEWQLRPEVSIHNIMADGTTVYAAHYQDGIRVVDISVPGAPVQTAWFNTWPGYDPGYGYSFYEGAVGLDLDLARRRLYVADSNRGLLVLGLP